MPRIIPRPEPARFDAALGAWLLSSWADVTAALRDPALVAGAGHARPDANVTNALLAETRIALEPIATTLAADLPAGAALDLVESYAVRVARALAVMVTSIRAEDVDKASGLAREVFL